MSVNAPTSARPGASMVEGEFAFTEADFRRISAMVHGDAGIDLLNNRVSDVYQARFTPEGKKKWSRLVKTATEKGDTLPEANRQALMREIASCLVIRELDLIG